MNVNPEKNKAVAEFLPDADEIEMRPLPRSAQLTLHIMLAAMVCLCCGPAFQKWISTSPRAVA
jgi:hypothetical protein